MTLQELEDAWLLHRRGRRRERMVLAFFLLLILGGGGYVGWRWYESRTVAAQESGAESPGSTSPR